MGKVYVECRWLINGFDIDEILRLSHVLECEIWRYGRFIYDEGYFLVPVFISADAEEIIEIFCETVQYHARFVQRKLASPADFQRANVTGWSSVSLRRYEQFLERWYAHNKRIEKGFAFWTHALWPVQPVNLKTLNEVINLAETSEISIYYRTAQQSPQSFELYFKVSSYDQFDVKLNEIGRIWRLEPWGIVHSLLTIEPEHNPRFSELESYSLLTRETIPTFLDAIKLYL